ncbi:hypothetical protein GYMLUDRAFT_33834, partial [Collybiopsis luxurians FD-317 M1]
MPKVTKQSEKESKSLNRDDFVILDYQSRHLALPRSLLKERSYQEAVLLIQKAFSIPQYTKEVVLHTSELTGNLNEVVEIPDVTWKHVIPFLSRIKVVSSGKTRYCRSPSLDPCSQTTTTPRTTEDSESGTIGICCRASTGWFEKEIIVPWDQSLYESCMKAFSTMPEMKPSSGVFDPTEWIITWDGLRLDQSKTPRDLGIKSGAELDIFQMQLGGKPVIYLWPPRASPDLDVTVKLSLVPQWKFSAIYPVVKSKVEPGIGETVTWDVRTHDDGTMTEKSTGLNVTYLYWEAITEGILPSPPGSPSASRSEYFDPLTCDITDNDGVSILLPLAELTSYLDETLKDLGLHTEARTSFITYWLPSFNKHTHIALRFASQKAYERAAPLNIVPPPDLVISVFMLFKGVPDSELGAWPNAIHRAYAGTQRARDVDLGAAQTENETWKWEDIVLGTDAGAGEETVSRLKDEQIFKVLEWGGMEVLGRR